MLNGQAETDSADVKSVYHRMLQQLMGKESACDVIALIYEPIVTRSPYLDGINGTRSKCPWCSCNFHAIACVCCVSTWVSIASVELAGRLPFAGDWPTRNVQNPSLNLCQRSRVSCFDDFFLDDYICIVGQGCYGAVEASAQPRDVMTATAAKGNRGTLVHKRSRGGAVNLAA